MTELKQATEATREPPADHAVGSQVDLVLGAWVPVTERMPPPNGRYLVWFDGDCIGIAHTFAKWKHPSHPLGYLIQGHGGSHNQVTHWMPLPDPPQSA
jgi:hypothetical protein